MRYIVTFLLIFTILIGFAQKKKKDKVKEVEDPKITEIRNICKELDIPDNPEANASLLIFMLDWRGTPYCYGGSSKSCTDCSGFTSNLYQDVFNKTIPRVSREIYSNCMPIEKHALYEGDLVFFATGGGDRITHVGVYLWDGYFAHASSSQGVIISRLREGYYKRTFVGGGAWIEE